jgi:rubrerythrin
MSTAIIDHVDTMMIDAWICSDCNELTYEAAGYEPPRFCCRCGARFEEEL